MEIIGLIFGVIGTMLLLITLIALSILIMIGILIIINESTKLELDDNDEQIKSF